MEKKKIDGFTLVELLVVIAIIGILAVALIPNLLSARSRATDVAARSYLKDAVIMQEVVNANKQSYTLTKADLAKVGLEPEPSGVTFNIVDANNTGYCMTATRTNGSGKVFHITAGGGLSDSSESPVCTAAG